MMEYLELNDINHGLSMDICYKNFNDGMVRKASQLGPWLTQDLWLPDQAAEVSAYRHRP